MPTSSEMLGDMWHLLQSADSKTIVGVLMLTTAASQTSMEADDILAFARQRLATFKCPTSVDFVTELPRNPSGKVLKRELRKLYANDAPGR